MFYVKAPCGHIYDIGCIASLVRSATSDESLFPPRCCSRPIGYNLFNALIPLDVWKAFERASQEFSVIAKDRVYCPGPTCSKFLGSVKVLPRTTACPTCHISVCTHCRQRAHPLRFFCKQEDETGALQGLLEQNRWQRCPNCRAVIELNHGCYHITCRCRSQFCYLCSAPWKTCGCRQWDDRMLVLEAERRVDAQIGLRVAQPQPARAAAPVTAVPPTQPAFPYGNSNTRPEGNDRATNLSNERRRVVDVPAGSFISLPTLRASPRPSRRGIAVLPSSANESIGQRVGNSSHHKPSGERGSFPPEHGHHGIPSGRTRRWVSEQGSSQGYQSRQKTQEKSIDELRQKRVQQMMELLRTNHDCNPHGWQKRNGGGECSECHHHLPLYLLVSRSIFK